MLNDSNQRAMQTYDVIVIGGGVIGASIACHLIKKNDGVKTGALWKENRVDS